MQIEYPAERQHSQHLRGEKGVGHRHAELTAAHPVIIILGVCTHFVYKTGIGFLPLIERLDDLNSVYIEHGAYEVSAERREQPRRICREYIFPGKQQHDHFCGCKIRHHAAGHAEYSENNGCDKPAMFILAQFPDALDRASIFHFESLL